MRALALALILMSLVACGKRGGPVAPGPAGEITYPRVYPTR